MTKIEKIAQDWGWDIEELLQYLDSGGSSNELHNISAMQTAHRILQHFIENNKDNNE